MQSISGTTATQPVTTVALRIGTLSAPPERNLTTPVDSSPETVFVHQLQQLVFARAIICCVLAFGMVMAALAWGAAAETLPSGTVEINQTRVALGDTGNGRLWLRNGDGVVLKLRGDGKGIDLTMGADAAHTSFK